MLDKSKQANHIPSIYVTSTDISEIESNRSCSPPEDKRLHHSDLESHSSNEKLKENQR